jgi:hypothetical protein
MELSLAFWKVDPDRGIFSMVVPQGRLKLLVNKLQAAFNLAFRYCPRNN